MPSGKFSLSLFLERQDDDDDEADDLMVYAGLAVGGYGKLLATAGAGAC